MLYGSISYLGCCGATSLVPTSIYGSTLETHLKNNKELERGLLVLIPTSNLLKEQIDTDKYLVGEIDEKTSYIVAKSRVRNE